MRQILYRDAIREALIEEMERDPSVFVMGEEVAEYQGTFRVTEGLLERFGPQRVVDTPISEEAFTGMAVGAAMTGLRPVVEYMTINFSLPAFDQIINHAAKMYYMSGGQFNVPLVLRGPQGPGVQLSAQHSQSMEVFFTHVPGLKVVAPGTGADAKGLLKAAIRDPNPVIYLEQAALYNTKFEVPEGEHLVPIGVAEIKRPGRDVTIVTYSHMLTISLRAAEELARQGIEAEVVDLRSLVPLDMQTVAESVSRTHRAVIATEDVRTCSFANEVVARLYEDVFDELDAPVERVTGEDVPIPYSRPLEQLAVPNEQSVISAVQRTLWREGAAPVEFAGHRSGATQGGVNGRADDAENGRRDGGRYGPPVAQERR
jgi:pyruvate/2-oxoglutarate/acetoin dehydrogenase E1 component